jgi:[histone H3]-lysine36 N-dimethyltransferase SETMAR
LFIRAKLHELGYELLPHPPYSPDLARSDFFRFANLKSMLAGKKFSTNEEVIAETDEFRIYARFLFECSELLFLKTQKKIF